MKLISLAVNFQIMLFAMLNVRGVHAQSPTPTSPPENETVDAGKTTDTSIHSAILDEDRRVIVHLPRNYSKNAAQKYPVMYVLDGTSQDKPLADKAAVLSDADLIPQTIVVGLPNTRGNRERDQTPPYMRRSVDDEKSPYGAADRFLSFIEKELIPYIDSNYRTTKYRTLSGNSRGGLFVLYSWMEKPDLFQGWFCHSTPVWRFEDMMVNRAAKFLRSASGLSGFLFVSTGDKETDNIVGGLAKLTDVLRKNPKAKFKWAAYRAPYATHQDNASISTSKRLVEWGRHLRAFNNRVFQK